MLRLPSPEMTELRASSVAFLRSARNKRIANHKRPRSCTEDQTMLLGIESSSAMKLPTSYQPDPKQAGSTSTSEAACKPIQHRSVTEREGPTVGQNGWTCRTSTIEQPVAVAGDSKNNEAECRQDREPQHDDRSKRQLSTRGAFTELIEHRVCFIRPLPGGPDSRGGAKRGFVGGLRRSSRVSAGDPY